MTFNFTAVGIGEGGGRIAAAFHEFGYRSFAINTAKGDLDGLSIPQDRKLLLQISQGGTGKDPSVVKQAFSNPDIRMMVKNFFHFLISEPEERGTLYVLLCIGGGGGSGSGLSLPIIEIALEFDVPIGVIYTLPNDDEDVITKTNAVTTFQQIYNEKGINAAISPLVLVDNAFMVPKGIPIKDFYYVVNKKIAGSVHKFNSFSALPSKYFSAVDTLDFGRVLSLGGVCGLGQMKIVDPTNFDLVRRMMHESLFISGMNIKSAKGVAVIATAPEYVLNNTHVSDCLRFVFEEAGRISGVVFRGVYEDPDSQDFNVYFIFNGMTFPQDRFNELWEDIRKGRTAVKRKEKRIDEMAYEIPEEDQRASNQSFERIKVQQKIKPIKMVICDNCQKNNYTKLSSNLYNGEGNMPFTSGKCPKCGGRGMYEYREDQKR